MYLENEKVDEIEDKLSQRDDGWGWEEEGGGADNSKLNLYVISCYKMIINIIRWT